MALDDFGAGYAGLNSLAALTADIVKLDIALVRDIDREKRQRIIALGMIKVCQELDIDVVAEGVERPEELAVLMDAGVRYIQGYLFARPLLNQLTRDEDIIFP